MSPKETIGDVEHVVTATHPPRTDSPEYGRTRKWLMTTAGGCYVCGGPEDLSHPGTPESASMQDHHGGGLYIYQDGKPPVLVGYNLFGTEWSQGWGALPGRIAAFVNQLNEVTKRLGGQPYELEIATVEDVMAYVDSVGNASVKLCAPHHVGHEAKHTPDINGHEAVGIHNGPFPIWLGQATCDFEHWDMFGGSTGTIVVGHPGNGSGEAVVLHVSPLHPDKALYEAHEAAKAKGDVVTLPAHHPHARLAHAGAHAG